ncbi:serine/threonine-protein kinase [Nocardioides jiangxiensis]|uniref:Serine/threonine-protein kinase n=1 Tax=Nocardioides jiangxiensis TaxID=3064524 RepID=A0ABT9B2P3_9ACTN|nr:serine/threonine-protein kinase [Nocardioides sp. WY-20]MDO7869126.1 serine/threonine-protein kinase [Nocardioides sp. WY-20]
MEAVRVGRWTLVRRLGEGGMGVVHLAEDERGRLAALKVLRPHVVGDEEARERLEREVATLSRVASPLVAEIVDSDPWGPVPYVATRYIDGPSLHDEITEAGPFTGPDLRRFAISLAKALQAVHGAGVMHRDVKPSNVVLDGMTPVLIDFGLARLGDDTKITRTGFLLGTPGYMAPEVIAGDEPGAPADVHSWAATVAFAGTGRAPYGSGNAMAVMDRVRRGDHDLDGLDPSLRIAVEAALDPDPLRRPTLTALVRVLDARNAALLPSGVPPRTVAAAPATRVMPVDEPPLVIDDEDDRPLWSEAPAGRRVPVGERLRRWTLGLGLLLLVAAGVAAAPIQVLAALALVVAVLRWGAVTADGHRSRRDARGRRWYDVPLAFLKSPVDLLVSLPVTVLLWSAAGVVGAVAVLAAALAGAPRLQWSAWAGLGVGFGLLLGPGSARLRRPVRGMLAPLARTGGGWLLTAAAFVALGGALAWSVWAHGVQWAPLHEAPWDLDWRSRLP